jgi:dinuclear metal center YbgI/SA1388 family protein
VSSASRAELIAFCDELLDVTSFPDHTPVGLQVAGANEVTKLVCSVSPSRELFERAVEADAQLVLCHHGLFWERDDQVIGPVMRERLRTLFDANLNFAAYHLALDAHAEVGNNAFLCRELGIEPERRFAGVGWGGTLREPVAASVFAERVQQVVGRMPLVFSYGPEEIRRVAVCSGGAARAITDAIDEGYDCFVTGEAAEPTKHTAKEAGIHFVAAGHYATETSGVQLLAAKIADRFGVEWEFVDLPNPV